MKKSSRFFGLGILVVFLLALVLRTYRLPNLPISLSMDEVTFGYAAYAVMETGRDEQGKLLPLYFRGIGDYKPPIDVYLKIPFIYIFGLNELSVRLPGAILGSLSVLFVILILMTLKFKERYSLLAGFWLAISGWHIFFSRAGFEAVTALFFLLAGLYFFMSWVRKGYALFFYLFILSFSLSVWSYHAERLFIPVLSIALIALYKKEFKKLVTNKRDLLQILLVLLFFLIPFLYISLFTLGVRARAEDLWIGKEIGLLDNPYGFFRLLVGQYLSYFDPRFIFWKAIGMTPKGYTDLGIIYFIDVPIILAGIYSVIKSKNRDIKNIVYLFLFLGPLPGAVARGDASPIRILQWVPLFAILYASGSEYFLEKRVPKIAILVYSLALVINASLFWSIYRNSFHKYYGDLWHYGYKEAANYVCENHQRYNEIVFTDKYGIELPKVKTIPHYYVLFHCGISPKNYLDNDQILNIEFRQPQWRLDKEMENALLIGSPWDFPEDFDAKRIMKIIQFPGGKPAFYFVETNEKN
ncbi:MAG: hypothetical protein UV74_C0013G0373 [Candidatus Woesebacteria bacterium GW2011_GWB1_43_14]|uniref:ArnT-like N-terminal domain-containing protein n=1 Tax=Candidatus Woesebacteria bacterium GW2011_GWB1_43_14 TaxID=1618578 RepID=A0A0G1FQE8_9BACT|nr:MAG: hypothetical protein UT21_C0001G0083 [Candidatus Woesebacteria bacterium GW2011_GWA1_39_11b]KKS78331.1 MAG: hypothetical protein UV51_C0001G0047 [Candidatus Woesebacteria bacterium GW2011_GWC1_42_9]KKS97251.1 MAG: hypothetical protein UV74_C0013G0373 [Candidatus Woesebacteria bacterium GW2011_GWB1_43_14]